MAKLSRGKIAYNLQESPYYYEVRYSDLKIKYMFSSELYQNNFKNKFSAHRSKINESLNKRFSIDIKVNVLADLVLYKTIEKRGFLLFINEDMITCLEKLELDGMRIKLND